MQKYCKILDDETGLVQIGVGCPDEYYIEIGMEVRDVQQSDIDGEWYLTDKCPMKPIPTKEEERQKEQERLNALTMTKADFWIALLDRDITKNDVIEKINLIPDEKLKAKTLIRINDADHFWRGDASMDVVGAMFGITSQDLNYLFEYKELPNQSESPAADVT